MVFTSSRSIPKSRWRNARFGNVRFVLREKKSNRKLIGIGYFFSLTHHNIFGLFNGQLQLLRQAEKRLLSLLFQYHIKFDNSFSDTIEIQ